MLYYILLKNVYNVFNIKMQLLSIAITCKAQVCKWKTVTNISILKKIYQTYTL